MKKITLIILAFILTSCSNHSRFEDDFKDCLAEKDIQLIIDINSIYDQFLLDKYTDTTITLDSAYQNLFYNVLEKGTWDGYILSRSKLLDIQNRMIKTGLWEKIFTDSNIAIDTEKNYYKCLKKVGKKDSNIMNICNLISDGDWYPKGQIISELNRIPDGLQSNYSFKTISIFHLIIRQMRMELVSYHKVENRKE